MAARYATKSRRWQDGDCAIEVVVAERASRQLLAF